MAYSIIIGKVNLRAPTLFSWNSEHGANINAVDDVHMTPLAIAAKGVLERLLFSPPKR